MLTSLSSFINKRPWLTLISMLVIMVVAGYFGSGVNARLSNGGFENKQSDSYKASERIKDFQVKESNIILLVTVKSGSVDDPTIVAAASQVEQQLREYPNVASVASYWSLGKTATMRGHDGKEAIIVADLTGSDGEVRSRIGDLADTFTQDTPTISVGVGGLAEINRQFSKQIEHDLKRAEIIALPLTLILLIIVFGSVVAGLIPILIGIFAILGAFAILYAMTYITEVSVYALNLTTMLGLGLAIDYSLFIVSRFRERLAAGDSVEKAVEQAIKKAGKTVLFSSLTVAVSLAALLTFVQSFLQSFAIAGVAVSLVAAFGAIVLLPAILRVLGHRVNSLAINRSSHKETGSKTWHRIALAVMRRPVPIILVIVAALLIIGHPFLHIDLGQSDDRSLPEDNPARVVNDALRRNFSSNDSAAITIVSQEKTTPSTQEIDTYAKSLSQLAGVDHVTTPEGLYKQGSMVSANLTTPNAISNQGVHIEVIPGIEPLSEQGEQLVKDVRALQAPIPVYVGGLSANQVDLKESLYQRLPYAILLISLATLVLLFMMFGSILVPIKALAINFLSLTGVFGLMVWIFQDGHLAGPLHFTPTGMIDATMPILMFCVAFGLSMDYEVFLLSRIKEQYDKEKDNAAAVAHGLERTGGIVTAAAFSISVVFFAFATSGVTLIKLFGLGLAIAVLLDAFVIRATLVPAFMKLAGDANWWAPKPLKKFQERFGITE